MSARSPKQPDLAEKTKASPEGAGGFAPHDYSGDGPRTKHNPDARDDPRHGADRGPHSGKQATPRKSETRAYGVRPEPAPGKPKSG